ncbi:MAG: hypothetical protein JWO38_3441 [Gemmataceae bacterium]|nr:hypothetical protein [Gemmataceae bacterium]
MSSHTPTDLHSIITAIREAWYGGRRIVPIVGAGLSVDSGIPIIQSLLRYFCKFQQYLEKAAYLPPGENLPKILRDKTAEFRDSPWEYVRAFGWPDRYELNQNLLIRLEQQHGRRCDQALIESSVRDGLSNILQKTNPSGRWHFQSLGKAVKALLPDPADPTHRTAFEAIFGWEDGENREFKLIGDWKNVVQYFTHYHGDFADSLFHRLTGHRGPSAGHRFLAFLVKLLAVRQVFTFNFDDLIEKSLAGEGIEHQVFGMEHGAELPSEALVRDYLSVIKMHGSNHALLLDERLDHPLDLDYKLDFLSLTGGSPLLLVVGCSGGDYRLRDLIEWVMTERGGDAPTVAWLHFEPYVPDAITDLIEKTRPLPGGKARIFSAATANPGLALQHIFSALSGRHPASPAPYVTHVERPLVLGDVDPPDEITPDDPAAEWARRTCVLLSTITSSPDPDEYPDRTASAALVRWSAFWTRRGFQTVWVDLESAHTLAAVVGTIIDQCRRFDPALAPSVLPLLDDMQDHVIPVAVRRARDALRRARYVVMFDGLEAYLWPPTAHHGEPTRLDPEAAKRLDRLGEFLRQLSADSIGESKLFVGLDRSKPRSTAGPSGNEMLEKYRRLADGLDTPGGPWRVKNLTPKMRPYSTMFRWPEPEHPLVRLTPGVTETLRRATGVDMSDEAWALILHVLSSIRRSRHLASLGLLLRPVMGGTEEFETVIRAITEGDLAKRFGLVRLEGGGVWFHRPVRDTLYTNNSRFAGRVVLNQCLGDRPDEEEYRQAVAQAFLLAAVHQWISRIYYTHSFVQSHDAAAFLEYTYHRVSSVRYLTILLALGHRSLNTDPLERAFERGYQDFAGVIRKGVNRVGLADILSELELGEKAEAAFGGKPVAIAELRGRIEDRHRREIQSLSRAWSRAEPVLRSQLPAEQLLFWTDSLRADDIPHRFDRVVVDYDESRRPRLYPPDDAEPLGRAGDALKELDSCLSHLRVKLHTERSDYDSAAAERWKALKDAHPGESALRSTAPPKRVSLDELVWFVEGKAPPPPEAAPGTTGRPIPTRATAGSPEPAGAPGPAGPGAGPDQSPVPYLSLEHLHYVLDAVVCLLKREQEFGEQQLPKIGRLLDAVERVLTNLAARQASGTWAEYLRELPAQEREIAVSDYNEAWLRYHHLRAELALGDVCIFASPIGFFGRPPEKLGDKLPALQQGVEEGARHIKEGLHKVRGQSPRSDGRFRSLILEPTADGSVYLPYRSAFHVLNGRTRWLAAARDPDVAADPKLLRDAFESSFNSFDLSRGGLSPGNRLIAALTEMYAVEACLARARIVLYPPGEGRAAAPPSPSRGPGNPPGAALEEAYAKYETVRLCLQRARNYLLSGRRNVIWWKLFYLLVAQYHADRLSLGLLRMLPASDRPGRVSGVSPTEFLLRLRRGYAAVRSGLDYQLPREKKASHWPWLSRVWLEMTLTAYVTGTMMVRRFGPGEREGADAVWEVIRHANLTARLLDQARPTGGPPVQPGTGVSDCESWIGEWLNEDLAKSPHLRDFWGRFEKFPKDETLAKTGDALRLRLDILETAFRLAPSCSAPR